MTDNSIPPTRRCTTCGVEYPATLEYFYKLKRGKYGLSAACKSCTVKRVRRWKRANPEKMSEQSRRWKLVNPEKRRESRRRWRAEHIEYRREYDLRWKRANREKLRETSRLWRTKYPEKHRENRNRWFAANPEKRRVHYLNYRARKRSLPDTFTREEWQRAVDYFNGCCAVCGRQVKDLFNTHTLAADHWIPLNSPDCPGTIATNIVPLCHGEDGCNNSKCDRDAESWLIQRFGNRRAKEILKRIQDYLESIK